MKATRIHLFKSIGNDILFSVQDGMILYKTLIAALSKNEKSILDFSHIKLITPTFLNAAIGQLYSQYDSHFLQNHLSIVNLALEDIWLLQKVIDNAKEYFKNEKTAP